MKNYSFSDLVNRTMTGEEQFYDCEEVDARIAELEGALSAIASLQGLTLLGDGQYVEGANAAFNQAASIAKRVL